MHIFSNKQKIYLFLMFVTVINASEIENIESEIVALDKVLADEKDEADPDHRHDVTKFINLESKASSGLYDLCKVKVSIEELQFKVDIIKYFSNSKLKVKDIETNIKKLAEYLSLHYKLKDAKKAGDKFKIKCYSIKYDMAKKDLPDELQSVDITSFPDKLSDSSIVWIRNKVKSFLDKDDILDFINTQLLPFRFELDGASLQIELKYTQDLKPSLFFEPKPKYQPDPNHIIPPATEWEKRCRRLAHYFKPSIELDLAKLLSFDTLDSITGKKYTDNCQDMAIRVEAKLIDLYLALDKYEEDKRGTNLIEVIKLYLEIQYYIPSFGSLEPDIN